MLNDRILNIQQNNLGGNQMRINCSLSIGKGEKSNINIEATVDEIWSVSLDEIIDFTEKKLKLINHFKFLNNSCAKYDDDEKRNLRKIFNRIMKDFEKMKKIQDKFVQQQKEIDSKYIEDFK